MRLAALGLLASSCIVAGADRTSHPAANQVIVQPDDGAGTVLSLMRGATRSIEIEVYLLTDQETIDVLLAAKQAGRAVAVILEPSPYRAEGANQPAYDRLIAAGVDVVWASARYPLTHAKLLMIDGRRAVIMTLNLTPAGLTTNREYLAIDDDPGDVADARAIFAADRVGAEAGDPTGRLVATPGRARARLTTLINSASQRLDVEMEELSDGGMVALLAATAARGVAVTVVAPARGRSPATNGALSRLADAGVLVRLLETPTIHAKAIVADQRWLYLGSMNLTVSSLDANREVGLILDDPTSAGRVAATIMGDATRGAAP